MEFDLTGQDARHAYKLLASLVVPRPIAWVTTLEEDGVTVNAAPFSFFNVLGTDPPIVGFAPGDKEPGLPKDTARNIRRHGEFVINLVDESCAEAMNLTSADLPGGQSEIPLAGLTTAPSSTIAVPRIAEAPVAIECREWSTLELGRNRLVIGLVLRLWIRDGIMDPTTRRVNRDAFFPIGRMEVPSSYCRTRDRFDLVRPASD